MIFMVGIELKNGSQILEFKKKGTRSSDVRIDTDISVSSSCCAEGEQLGEGAHIARWAQPLHSNFTDYTGTESSNKKTDQVSSEG